MPRPNGARAADEPARGDPFSSRRYYFTTGVPAGEPVSIRNESGDVVLSHRSFASITGTVASLVTAIIVAAGMASALFLLAERQPLGATAALVLTLVFAMFVAMMVPKISVTLYDDGLPALTLWQRSVFPSSSWIVVSPEGIPIGTLRRTLFSRFGRNRWVLFQDGRPTGEAFEDGFGRAIVRKFLGKFSRQFETDIVIEYGGLSAGRIIRRPSAAGAIDMLDLTGDILDRRLAVGIAAIILGREP